MTSSDAAARTSRFCLITAPVSCRVLGYPEGHKYYTLRAVSLPALLEAVEALPEFTRSVEALPPICPRLHLSGLEGSSDSVVTAALSRHDPGRFFVVVAEGVASAERWLADLESLDDELPRSEERRVGKEWRERGGAGRARSGE